MNEATAEVLSVMLILLFDLERRVVKLETLIKHLVNNCAEVKEKC